MRRFEKLQPIFLVGAPRSGTTSLANWLSQVSCIQEPTIKEPIFFEKDCYHGVEGYRNQYFPSISPSATHFLDARPQHSFLEYVPRRIHDHFPEAKIIFILRDPIERIYSWWKMYANMRYGREEDSFDAALFKDIKEFRQQRFRIEGDYVPYLDPRGGCYRRMYIQSGLYYSNVMRYIRRFGERNVKILFFQDLRDSPEELFQETLRFCQVQPPKKIRKGRIEFEKQVIERQEYLEPPTIEAIEELHPSIVMAIRRTLRWEIKQLAGYTGRDLFTEWNFK